MDKVDTNKILNFIAHWLFAGFWATVGWALCAKFLLPHIPGL
jgi:hypothetical protein